MGNSLEEEILQKKFRSVLHKVQLNILFTAGWLESKHSGIFKNYQLTSQQYNVLRILRGSYPTPCTLLMIRSRMLDRMSDTSRLVEKLRKNGFIQRMVNSNDRRSVNIIITNKGLALLKSMEHEEETMDNIASSINQEEAELLNTLLDKIRN
jgi:DNA-binding MarR family transcriptional regulator